MDEDDSELPVAEAEAAAETVNAANHTGQRHSTDDGCFIRYDTIRYGRLTCAQKLTGWTA